MTTRFTIEQIETLTGCLADLHDLLNRCYPKPPCDVFYRLVEQYRPGFPAWVTRSEGGKIIGFVHLAPSSKGGTLETLAVHPEYRHLMIGQALVQQLLNSTMGVVSLTTRIPVFFTSLGFELVKVLPDQSVFMIHVRFDSADTLLPETHK